MGSAPYLHVVAPDGFPTNDCLLSRTSYQASKSWTSSGRMLKKLIVHLKHQKLEVLGYLKASTLPVCLQLVKTRWDAAGPGCLSTALLQTLRFLSAVILDLPGIQCSAETCSNIDWGIKIQTVQHESMNLHADPASAWASPHPALAQFPDCFQILTQTTEIFLGYSLNLVNESFLITLILDNRRHRKAFSSGISNRAGSKLIKVTCVLYSTAPKPSTKNGMPNWIMEDGREMW